MLIVLALGFLGFASARICYEIDPGYIPSGLTAFSSAPGYSGDMNLNTCEALCEGKYSNVWGVYDSVVFGTNHMCTCYTGGPGGTLQWNSNSYGTFAIIGTSGYTCGGCFTGYEEYNGGCRVRQKVCTCPHGTGATGSACPDYDAVWCGSCSGDRYLSNGACLDWTVCSTSQYESTSPTNTRNRVCSTKECTCSTGTGATGSACPTHDTDWCGSCLGDMYPNNGVCMDWTVCSTSQYESTSPTNTQNRVCSTKECTCSGGTGATGSACPTHNTAKCASCDAGYHPNGDACDINTCVCNTGPGTTGSECPTHDTYKCEFENIYPPGCSEGTLCTSVKATFFTYDGKVSRDVHPISMIFGGEGEFPLPKAPYFIFGADTTPYTLAEYGSIPIGDMIESEAECTSALKSFGFLDSTKMIPKTIESGLCEEDLTADECSEAVEQLPLLGLPFIGSSNKRSQPAACNYGSDLDAFFNTNLYATHDCTPRNSYTSGCICKGLEPMPSLQVISDSEEPKGCFVRGYHGYYNTQGLGTELIGTETDYRLDSRGGVRRVGKEPRENGNSLDEGGYRFVITDMQGVVKSIGYYWKNPPFQGDMSDLTFTSWLNVPSYLPHTTSCLPDYYCISNFEYTYPVCTSSQTQLTAPCSTETCSQEECSLCADNTYKLKLTSESGGGYGWKHYRLKVNGVYYFIPWAGPYGSNDCQSNSRCTADNKVCDLALDDEETCTVYNVSDQSHIITLPVGTQLNVVGSGWLNEWNYVEDCCGSWSKRQNKWSLECNSDGTMVYNFDPDDLNWCKNCKIEYPSCDSRCDYYNNNPLIRPQYNGESYGGDLVERMSDPGDIVNYCSTCSMTSFCPAHNVYSGGVCEQGVCIAGTAGSPCKECLPTTYQDQSGQTECKVCPNGWYQDQLGQSSCKTCPTNMTPTSNKLDCECISGYFGSPCTACAAGRFSSDNSCEACPNGWAQDQLGQTECEECAAGEISTGDYLMVTSDKCSTYITNVEECEAARVSLGLTGSVISGHWGIFTTPGCNYNTITNNVFFEVGTLMFSCYSSDSTDIGGRSGCICKGNIGLTCFACPAGTEPSADKTSCDQCEAGKNSSGILCEYCPDGTYQDQVGQSTCKSCSGFSTPDKTSCVQNGWKERHVQQGKYSCSSNDVTNFMTTYTLAEYGSNLIGDMIESESECTSALKSLGFLDSTKMIPKIIDSGFCEEKMTTSMECLEAAKQLPLLGLPFVGTSARRSTPGACTYGTLYSVFFNNNDNPTLPCDPLDDRRIGCICKGLEPMPSLQVISDSEEAKGCFVRGYQGYYNTQGLGTDGSITEDLRGSVRRVGKARGPSVDITFMNCFNTCKDYRGLESPRCITNELWTGRCTEYWGLHVDGDPGQDQLAVYPPRLSSDDDLYDPDPIIECKNRCRRESVPDGFTLDSSGRCHCSSGTCSKADSTSGYTSYSYECQEPAMNILIDVPRHIAPADLGVTHPRQIFHRNTFYFSNQKCICFPPFHFEYNQGPQPRNGCASADNDHDRVISTSDGDYGFTYEYHNCEVYDSREVCEDIYELADKQCYWDGSQCHTMVGSIIGCTDTLGCNFNNLAVIGDNSCILPDSIQCQSCSGETDGTGTVITGVNPPLFSDSCGCAGGTLHKLMPVPSYDLTATTAYSLTRAAANGNIVAIGLGTHIYMYEYTNIYQNSTVWTQLHTLEIDYTSFTLSADGYTLAVGHSNSVSVYKYDFFIKDPPLGTHVGGYIENKKCEYPSRMVNTIEECRAASSLFGGPFQVYDSFTEDPYYQYCFTYLLGISKSYLNPGVSFIRVHEEWNGDILSDRPCTEHSQCVCKGWTEKVITAEGNVKSLGLNNDGTILAVGTAGAVNVYEYSNEWVETAEIQDSDFGEELAISGDGTLLAVAAPRIDTPGYVNVYRHASGWTLDDTMNGAKGFGRHLALSVDGSTLAVGNDENSIVSVYKYSDAWTKTDVVGPGSPSKPSLTEDGTILSVAGSSVQVYSYSDSWQLMADFSEYRDISLGQLGGNMFAVTDTSVDVISLNSCCVRGANGAPCVYGTPDGTRGDCSCICTEFSFGVNCENCPPGYYHGEDDCEPNQCLCSNGTAATLAVCPSHGDFKCVACDAGYHLEGIECIINQCTCSGGTAGIGTDCPVHGTGMCTQCDADYYLDGVSCKAKVCTCAQGKAARGFECEVHGTEQCSQCEDFADECGCVGSKIGNSISQPNAVIATSGNVVAIAGPDKVFVYELLDEWKEEQTIPFLGAVSLSLNADGSVLAITGSPGGANCAYGYRSEGYCSNTVYLKDENGDDLPYPPLLPDDDPLYDPDRNQECMNRCSAEYGPGKGFSTKQGTGLGNGVYELYCACASDNCDTVEDPSFGPIYYSYITTCDRTVIYKKDGPTRRQIPIENPAGNYVELNNDGSVVLVVSNTHAYVYTLSRYKPLEYVQYRYQKSYQEVGLTASMSGDGKVVSVGSDTKTSVYKMMYEVKTNGDCTSPINNPEECEAAAAELGYSFLNTRVEMSSSHTGCLRLTADGDYFQFNSFFNSPVSDCGGVGNCVCKHWVHDGDIDEVPSSLSLNKDGTILASVLSTGIRVRRSNTQIGQDISVTENGIISLNDNGNTMSYTTDIGSIHVYTFKDSWYPPVWHNTKSYSLSAAGPVILIMKSSSSINADTEGGPWYGFRLSVGGTIYGSTFISGSQQTEEISGLSSMFVSKANAGVFPNQASWEIRCKYGDTLMLSGNAWTSSTFENTCLDGSPTFSHISRSGSTLAYSENIISLSSCCLNGGNGQPCNNPTGTRGSCACVCAAGEHNVGDLCCEEGKNFVHDGQCSYTCRTGFDHLLCRTEPSILYQIDSGDTLVSLDWSQNRLISKSADTVNRQTSSETTVTFAGFIGTNSYVVHGSACGTVTVAKTFSGHPLKIVAGDLTWNQAMAADPIVQIQNEGSETFTMTEPVYTYICESHPTMIGKLVKCMNELDVNQNVITVYENNPETLTGQLGEEITFAEYGFGNSIVTASQLGVTIWDEFPRLDMCRETSPPAFQTFEERNEWYPAMKMCKAVQETPFYVGTTCTTLTSDECHVAKAIISEEVDDTCSFTGSQSSLTFTGAVGSYTVEGTACGEVTVKKTFSGHPLKIVAGNLTWNESMAAVPVVSIPNTGSETFTMVEQVYTYICESHSDMIGQLVQECTQKLCKIEEECGTNGDCICGEIYEDPSCATPLQPGLCEASGGSFNRGACRLNNKILCLETHKSFDANLECCGCGGGETRGTTKSVYHIVKDGVSECVCSEDTECDEDDEDTSMSSFIYGMLLPYVYVGKGACEDLSVVTVEGKSIPERMTYCAAACSSVGTDAFGLNNTHCVCTGHCDNDVPVDRFAFTSSYDIRYSFDEDVILQAWDSQSRHLRCFKDLERKQEVMCSHIRALKHFARGTSYRVGDCEHEAGGTTNQIPCNGRGFVVSGTCYCDYAETLDVSQTSLGIQYEPPTLLQTPYRGKHCGHFCPGYNMQDMESVCSGHGVCASTANCDCDQSFAGYKCHVQCELEPGPLTCSGHGTCEEQDTDFEKDDSYKIADTIRGWDSCPEELGYLAQDRVIQINDVIHYMFRDLSDMRYERYNVSLGEYFMWLGNAYCDMPGYTLDRLVFSSTPEEFAQACETKCVAYMGFNINFLDRKCQCIMQADVSQCNTWTDSSGDIVGTLVSDDDWQVYAKKEGDVLQLQEERIASMEDYYIFGSLYRKTYGSEEPHMPCYDSVLSTREKAKSPLIDIPSTSIQLPCAVLPNYRVVCGTCKCFEHATLGHFTGYNCRTPAVGYYGARGNKVCRGMDEDNMPCNGHGTCNWGSLLGLGKQVDTQTQCFCGVVDDSVTFDTAPRNNDGEVMVHVDNLGDPLYVRTIKYANTDCSTNGFNEVLSATECREASAYMGNSWAEDVFQTAEGGCTRVGSTMYLTKNVEFETEEVVEECITSLELMDKQYNFSGIRITDAKECIIAISSLYNMTNRLQRVQRVHLDEYAPGCLEVNGVFMFNTGSGTSCGTQCVYKNDILNKIQRSFSFEITTPKEDYERFCKFDSDEFVSKEYIYVPQSGISNAAALTPLIFNEQQYYKIEDTQLVVESSSGESSFVCVDHELFGVTDGSLNTHQHYEASTVEECVKICIINGVLPTNEGALYAQFDSIQYSFGNYFDSNCNFGLGCTVHQEASTQNKCWCNKYGTEESCTSNGLLWIEADAPPDNQQMQTYTTNPPGRGISGQLVTLLTNAVRIPINLRVKDIVCYADDYCPPL